MLASFITPQTFQPNPKVFLNLLRFSNEWWFLSTKKFLKFVFSLFHTFNFSRDVRVKCKTGYCSLPIFISFVKLIVVININEQSNVRSQNGSCASNSALTLVFLHFLRFYCLPRSLESLHVSFPVLSNLFRGKLVVIHTAKVLFQKYHNTLCCPSKVLH